MFICGAMPFAFPVIRSPNLDFERSSPSLPTPSPLIPGASRWDIPVDPDCVPVDPEALAFAIRSRAITRDSGIACQFSEVPKITTRLTFQRRWGEVPPLPENKGVTSKLAGVSPGSSPDGLPGISGCSVHLSRPVGTVQVYHLITTTPFRG